MKKKTIGYIVVGARDSFRPADGMILSEKHGELYCGGNRSSGDVAKLFRTRQVAKRAIRRSVGEFWPETKYKIIRVAR